MWLNINPTGIEKFLYPVDGQLFTLVDYLATTIVTLTGKSLCILIGQAGTHGLQYLV